MRLLHFNNLLLRKTFPNGFNQFKRSLMVLGIETSCDDTGAAVILYSNINNNGQVLGFSLHSQEEVHIKYGGIIPPIAQKHHRANIERIVNNCLMKAAMEMHNIDAIAVTNRPGLPMSLNVGVRYAKHLARKYEKPLVPIHHMEAHALTVRLTSKVDFPFLCLLVSGGHCQLTLVKKASEFYLLGETLDDAPGEAFDKMCRYLKLRNIKRFENLNGGAAMEIAASESANPTRYEFPLPLARYRNCQFSFSGLKNVAKRYIRRDEKLYDIGPDAVIPDYKDFCASFLRGITRHICHRTQRAIEFCQKGDYFQEDYFPKSLVVSGGVACNDFIFNSLSNLSSQFNLNAYRPAKKFCSDNGAMIAWNGIEKILENKSSLETNIDEIGVIGKCSLGQSIIKSVEEANISCKWAKVF